ncbi:hypothetical protein [Cohnella silvisoli]|uniref:Uncharacterized protein n=1 Tax=Cohnella silvisoli TaxID=2873699 RepID=A0ABV1KMZ4_9BACL|nr:hypothetical protein [Cohnella silvisoli]MCD9020218.1 hypothetical protein [Cohnella silvisoli]
MEKLKYDISRYLCAAAEISPKFRSKVFEQILHNTVRYVAPSYGVDVPLVVKHCLRGHTRDFIVDALISVAVLWTFIGTFKSHGIFSGIPYFVYSLVSFPLLLAFLLKWLNLYVGFRVVVKDLKNDQHNMNGKKSFMESQYEQRLQQLEKLQEGNIAYYSGYSPFVGAGVRLGGWSFVCGTAKRGITKSEHVVISLPDLYRHINKSMNSLHIPHLSIKDMIYVDGKSIRNDSRFLSNPYEAPSTHVADFLIDEYKVKQEENVRYYQTVQVLGWQGNFVFSSFFRISKNDQHLFVEANYYLLPPLESVYYEIDRLHSSIPVGILVKMALSSIIPAIISLPTAPLRAVRSGSAFFASWKEKKETKKQIDEDQRFDYGAYESLREMAATNKLQNFFQQSDVDMYRKQIERCFTDSIMEFLESQGVDISEFVQRKETVINQGIMVNGGSFTAENVSVGNQAQMLIHQAKNVVQNSSV